MTEPDRPSFPTWFGRGLLGGTLMAVIAGTSTSLFLGVRAAAPKSDGGDIVAILGGEVIPVEDVALHHCHDGEYPVIGCFHTEAERDQDASLPVDGTLAARATVARNHGPATRLAQSLSVLFYVTFYQNASYGGASFTASQPYSDLRDIGWSDLISSFKSLNGKRPKWWEHIGYVAPAWQWAAGAQVSYVGDGANDRFSSTKNVP